MLITTKNERRKRQAHGATLASKRDSLFAAVVNHQPAPAAIEGCDDPMGAPGEYPSSISGLVKAG